jgi:hypothetical protein
VLRFDELQRLNGALPAFINEFWQPLARTLRATGGELPNRLSCLVSFVGALDDALQPHLFFPASAAAFDHTQLIALPALEDFTEREIAAWLREQRLPPAKAKDTATLLMRETGGHAPALFLALLKDALWND